MIKIVLAGLASLLIFLGRLPEFYKDIKIWYYRKKLSKAKEQTRKYQIKIIMDNNKDILDAKSKKDSISNITDYFSDGKF